MENFELLMCHRYYISDLCQMIERAYVQDKVSKKTLVYRADQLSKDDFQKIEDDFKKLKPSVETKNSTGEESFPISMNGFISTSSDVKVCVNYVKHKLKKHGDEYVMVMYEITIDPKIPSVSYADLHKISFHPDEKEILFNIGSTFQIDDIVPDPRTDDKNKVDDIVRALKKKDANLQIDDIVSALKNGTMKWIKLTARDFHSAFLDVMKTKLEGASQATLSIQLVRYLIELGEDRVCKRYLKKLVVDEVLDNDLNLVKVFNCLGIIYLRLESYGQALESFRRALNTQTRMKSSDNNALAEIFNYIGQTHLGLKQLEAAEQNLEEGVRIQLREPKVLQQQLASLYCNLGRVAYAQGYLFYANDRFTKAVDLYRQSSKGSSGDLEKQLQMADLCIAFGHLKSAPNSQDPTKAHEMFAEALKLYQRLLPASHPKVAETHINIICKYVASKQFLSVINYYEWQQVESQLEDYQTKPSTSQRDLANLYLNLGVCYAKNDKFDDAVKMWGKAIEYEQRSYLDELLSSARVPKVTVDNRLIDDACRLALSHRPEKSEAKNEHFAVLHMVRSDMGKVIERLQGHTSFLLAWAYFDKNNFEKCWEVCKQLRELPKPDYVRLVGLLVALSKTKFSPIENHLIDSLMDIEKELKQGSKVAEAERVRMIINDHLADAFLHLNDYEKARKYDQASFQCKTRYYSSYHPSLIRNYQFRVSWCFAKNEFNKAVENCKEAIEIQQNNMSSNHAGIRANYFWLGDCYCQLDKLGPAIEYYERARSSNDPEAVTAVKPDAKALLRMHSYLSDMYTRREDFNAASSHQQSKIDQLTEILPTWIVTMMEEEDGDLQMNFDDLKKVIKARLGLLDRSQFGRVLQNLIYVRSSHARVLLELTQRNDYEEDLIDVFQQVTELRLKLTLFESPNETDLVQHYEELAQAYRRLSSKKERDVQENLLKAIEKSGDDAKKRSTEFRLGNLYYAKHRLSEADQMWRSALKKVKDDQLIMKSIIEKKIKDCSSLLWSLGEDEDDDNNDDNYSEESSSTTSIDEETENSNDEEQSGQKERQPATVHFLDPPASSTKSVPENERPGEYAEAYVDLGHDATALKYLKKHIAKLEETAKPTYPEMDIEIARSSLVQLYFTLMDEAIKSKEIPNEPIWTSLLQAQIKCYLCAHRLGDEFATMATAATNVYYIVTRFHLLSDDLTSLFDVLLKDNLNEVQWETVTNHRPLTEAINIFIRVADYLYCKGEYIKALKVYFTLQDNVANDPALLSMINFGILKLLEVNVAAVENHCTVVEKVDIKSSTTPIFDRILLCRLIIDFYGELDYEERVNSYQKRLVQLYREEWPSQSLKDTPGIGQELVRFDHHRLASYYWQDLQDLYVEVMPDSLTNLLYVSESTFEELYRSAQEISNDLSDHLQSLAESYEFMSDYDNKCGFGLSSNRLLRMANTIRQKMEPLNKTSEEWQSKLDSQRPLTQLTSAEIHRAAWFT